MLFISLVCLSVLGMIGLIAKNLTLYSTCYLSILGMITLFMYIFVFKILLLTSYIYIDFTFFRYFFIIFPVLISVAFLTLLERKILGAIQRRRGPNVVGIFGFLQAFADAFKLLSKETIIPISSNKFIFVFSSIFSFVLSLLNWSVIPFDYNVIISNISIGAIFVLAISSLGVFSIIMAG
jgi:NADH:ubiquinone oxidoreductase subunit H